MSLTKEQIRRIAQQYISRIQSDETLYWEIETEAGLVFDHVPQTYQAYEKTGKVSELGLGHQYFLVDHQDGTTHTVPSPPDFESFIKDYVSKKENDYRITLNLTELEAAVLKMTLEGEHPILESLRSQLAVCHVQSDIFSGVGFFTKLRIEPDSNTIILPDLKRLVFNNVLAEASGLEYGAGFLLFIDDGLMTTLEGYCYDESWPDEIVNFGLSYGDGETRPGKN